MRNPKYAWCHIIVVYAILSMLLVGCTSYKSSEPIISSIDYYNGGSNKTSSTASQLFNQSNRQISCIKKNNSLLKDTVYHRKYNRIPKGYYSDPYYKVKYGDTLFYIAWITGSNYQDLAKRNKILKLHNLYAGQILYVVNSIVPNTSNTQASNIITNSILSNRSTTVFENTLANSKFARLNINDNENYGHFKRVSNPNSGRVSLLNSKITSTTSTISTRAISVTKPIQAIATVSSDRLANTSWYWPTDGKITNNFSLAKGGNTGLYISGYRGQPILATAKGQVVYTGNALRGYGNLIIIKHNNNYLSAYAHNDTMLVSEQEEVRAGQKIATMGCTGSESVRLHFEIRYKGKSVNPLHYLQHR